MLWDTILFALVAQIGTQLKMKCEKCKQVHVLWVLEDLERNHLPRDYNEICMECLSERKNKIQRRI